MILVGQYDSPYTRRVAVSLGLLGFGVEHDTRSVFATRDRYRRRAIRQLRRRGSCGRFHDHRTARLMSGAVRTD
jgi:hypothetical protein